MEKKDPFDELLMRCMDDGNGPVIDKKTAEGIHTTKLVNCGSCSEVIYPNYRYCPNCGEPTVENTSETSKGFTPLVIQKKLFRVSLLDLDRDFSYNGEYYTKVRLRVENLTEQRLHLSLTFVDSVVINSSGRQFSPADNEEFDIPELFEAWFYVYPRAYREGVIIFPEIAECIKSLYICCNPQNVEEEELFHFVIESR